MNSSSSNSEDTLIDTRNRIVVKWLWLVSAIAHKLYHSYSQSFPEMRAALCAGDLIQEGVCGLMQAVDKWDASRGYAFDSYAFYSIKHAVIRAVQNQSRPIRLPVHVLEKLSRMRKVAEILRLKGRAVTVDAIAQAAGVSRPAAELYLQRKHSTVSIDAPIANDAGRAKSNNQKHHDHVGMSGSGGGGCGVGGGGVGRVGVVGNGGAGGGVGGGNVGGVSGSTATGGGGSNGRGGGNGPVNHPNSLSHFLIDHSVDVARHVERECTKEAVAQLVKSADLLELERSVLFLKFGLDDGVERVRAEVSRILDVRVHNVRRAELSALRKLRESIGDDMDTWTELMN